VLEDRHLGYKEELRQLLCGQGVAGRLDLIGDRHKSISDSTFVLPARSTWPWMVAAGFRCLALKRSRVHIVWCSFESNCAPAAVLLFSHLNSLEVSNLTVALTLRLEIKNPLIYVGITFRWPTCGLFFSFHLARLLTHRKPALIKGWNKIKKRLSSLLSFPHFFKTFNCVCD
jgi:hypothetical protein